MTTSFTQNHCHSSFLKEFIARGFFYQCTDLETLDQQFATKSVVAYLGFDCTAPSLHVGNLLQIMILRLLQKHGHKPLVLIGGGTTRVGDPSGKDESRKMLSDDDIATNVKGLQETLSHYIRFGNGTDDATLVNNADWLLSLGYVDFLRDYGRHFSVNRMLTMDSVRLRLEREQNLTFLEFNYMLLQAYDFSWLQQQHGCSLQIGGSDQWGNIVSGVELNRRLGRDATYGLTTPLITTASGAKMGKSVSGAVWLRSAMLSPYDYWQFWRNAEDGDVIRFMKLYTDLSLEQIAEYETLAVSDINAVKKILANEATRLCHGSDAAQAAADAAVKMFEHGTISENLPVFLVSELDLAAGIPAYQLFHMADFASSGGEARKLIRAGGARINDEILEDETMLITASMMLDGANIKLSSGKKKHKLVKIGSAHKT
jgi:tyrosyl-tRNA synthetase